MWNLLHVTVPALGICRRPLELWKTFAHLPTFVPSLYTDRMGISKSLEHGTRKVEDKLPHKSNVIFNIDYRTITRFRTFNRTCPYYGTTSGRVKTRFPSFPISRQVTSVSFDRFNGIIFGGNSSYSKKIFTLQKRIIRIMVGAHLELHVAVYLKIRNFDCPKPIHILLDEFFHWESGKISDQIVSA